MVSHFGKSPTLIDGDPISILPKLEYECRDRRDERNLICSWSTKRLLAGFSVLDNKPYSRCSLIYSINEFPIFISRKMDKSTVATVVIAPEEWTVKADGYPVPEVDSMEKTPIEEPDLKTETQWITHIDGTTWWIVRYTDTGEWTMKCSNCGFEETLLDFRSEFRLSHPLCDCWCSCERCEKIRYQREFINNMQWYSRKKWA